jgi:hypothetical protein
MSQQSSFQFSFLSGLPEREKVKNVRVLGPRRRKRLLFEM